LDLWLGGYLLVKNGQKKIAIKRESYIVVAILPVVELMYLGQMGMEVVTATWSIVGKAGINAVNVSNLKK